MRLSLPLRTFAAAVAAAVLVPLGAASTAAASIPGPVGPGALYREDFADGLSDWTAVTATTAEWSAADGTVGIDTRGQASGRYIRPTASLDLPPAYELRTHVRIDAVESTGTVTLMLDMRDTTNWKTTGISPQFTGFDGTGTGTFRIAKPIASNFVCQGLAPTQPGGWLEVVVRRASNITAVYADGQLIGAAESPLAGGTIGLGAFKSSVRFGPISIDPLASTPADHPVTAAGCPWTEPVGPPDTPPGDGEVSGSGQWVPAEARTSDRPGHEVTGGQSTISLDGDWKFRTDADGTGAANGYHLPATSVDGWRTQRVPGNWDLHDDLGRYTGDAWYRRTFESGDLSAAAGERAWLRFGAVYNDATVWLNGAKLGSHIGGYTPFEFDVTEYLVDGPNTLVVLADNTFQQGAWWSWGGISRSVELVKTGEVIVDRQQIVSKPNLATGTAHVESTVFLANAGDQARTVTLTGAITDADTGAVVADGMTAQVAIPAGGGAQAVLSTDLPAGSFSLWSMDDPSLYRLDLSLDSPVNVDDAAQSDRFGIREFRIEGTKMLLNNEILKLAGANRVSDDPISGNVEPTWVVRRDLDRMKASGMNATRIMHYAQAPELLDYADEIGMLLIDEVPVWGTDRHLTNDIGQIKNEFREMVERDFNHASIFAHSVANEIESNTPHGLVYLKAMADYSHLIDPSRFVTHANNRIERATTTAPEQDGSIYMDYVSVNQYGSFAAVTDKVHSLYPTKPVHITEFSPDGFTFPISRETLDFATGVDSTSATYKTRDYVFGWSQWTYNDYRSDYSGSSANLVRGWGNVDVWGRLKSAHDEVQIANAPVKTFALGDVATTVGGGLATVSVTPSGAVPTDGPSNVLRGYRVTVQAFDAAGKVVGGGLVTVPDITPGAGAFQVPLAWQADSTATRVRATLLSRTGFEVAVSVKDAAKPAAPSIRESVVANATIRVRYEDPADIGRYKVVATAPDGTIATVVTTRERFADLAGLVNGTEYTVTVAAVGSTGAGAAATVKATPTGSLTVPPKVVNLEPVEQGLVLGYSSPTRDGSFEVQVTDAASDAVVKSYTTKNRPGTFIEGLTPGTAVNVRIREVSSTGAAISKWSDALRATPIGAQEAPKLDVLGVIAGTNDAGVVLAPSNRTERYLVTVTGPGVDSSFAVERAAVDLIPVNGLSPEQQYTVTVRAEGAGGASAPWIGTVTTRAASTGGDSPVVSTADRTARADGSVPFSTTGTWASSSLTAPGGFPSVYSDVVRTPGATATWTGPVAEAGTYRIEVALPANNISSTTAKYAVTSADGVRTVAVDQIAGGGTWVDLGEFRFTAGQRPTVRLTGDNGFLRASAARFTETTVAGLQHRGHRD